MIEIIRNAAIVIAWCCAAGVLAVIVGLFSYIMYTRKGRPMIEVLERKDYHGCEMRKERLTGGDAGLHEGEMVYASDGGLVGTPKEAHQIIVILGIMPQRRVPENSGCSVGFSERDQRWWGWSHRGGQSYGIGDDYFAGLGIAWMIGEPRTIQTLEEARQSAYKFAESVAR